MAATEFQIKRLRMMVDEPFDSEIYTPDYLASFIEQYPLPDSDGLEPDEDNWVATYDLHAAAADVWQEKAATQWDKFTFAAVGEATYQRSTKHDNAMKMVKYHLSRRSAQSRKLKTDLPENAIPVWVGNINDPFGEDV